MPFQSELKKFVQTFKTYFNRRKPKTDAQGSDAQETDKEHVAQNPGDVRMNSGTHKKVYVFRRRTVGFTMVGLLIVFLLSYVFFQDDNGVQSPKPDSTAAQGTKTPSHMGEEASRNELSYRDLRALDQRNQGRQGRVAHAQATEEVPTEAKADRVHQRQPDTATQSYAQVPSQEAPVYVPPLPTIPPAPSIGYGEGSATGASVQHTAADAVKNAEQRAEEEREKRFASAIEFALGKMSADADASAEGNPVQQTETSVAPESNTLQLAHMSPAAASPYVVQAGTLIPAMLFTGIDTSVPGQVMAQVSVDVYDSLTRTNILIPAGARLLGTYESGADTANGRVNVVFSTLILPNGDAFDIGSGMVAVDGGGYRGLLGKVHRHTSRVIGAGMISSAIAALGSLASGNTSARDTYTGGQIAMQGALANLIATTSNMMAQGANVRPHVTVEPGHMFQVYVMQPIAFNES